jgi:hypothetical protein
MKKLTDEELDSVFRQAARGFQPAFDAGAWKLMNERLDEPKRAVWKQWLPYFLAGSILFSAGVWVGIRLSKKESTIPEKAMTVENELNHSPAENTPKPSGNRASEGSVDQMKKTRSGQNSFRKNSLTAKKAVLQDKSKVSAIEIHEPERAIREGQFLGLINGFEKEDSDSLTGFENVVARQDSAGEWQKGDREAVKVSRSPSFSVRLMASPDLSSINFNQITSPGSNFALQVEYMFNHRFSVSTGVVWSKKKYVSDNEVLYAGHPADGLKGICSVLDIPINFQYYFRPQSPASFYASVGLSSYMMLTEEYSYSVRYTYSTRQYNSYIKGKNNEWFKMLNLSVGVQQKLGTHWVAMAEPFVKIPMAGVGEGDVQLATMGLFIGAKYIFK